MVDLRSQVALVTGGGRGLGAAAARALAASGAKVGMLGRTEATLAEVVDTIREQGQQAVYAVADTSRWDQVSVAIAAIRTELGPISILVNNAAVNTFGRVDALDPEEWGYSLAVNLNGVFYCIHAVLPDMLGSGWGRILNISSGAAVGAAVADAAYSIAKGGVNQLTRVLALELAGTGVVPISVSPGLMNTDMQAEMRTLGIPETDMYRDFHAQGWLRPPEEAARLLCWLCGPEADEFAGQFILASSSALRARVGLPQLPEALRQP